MRAAATVVLTILGFVGSFTYPAFYILAPVVCISAAVILVAASLWRPWIKSLRAATIQAIVIAAVSLLVAVLAAAVDLSGADRVIIRSGALALLTGASMYWLILLSTGGFNGDSSRAGK